jgi:hypothetical protein
VGEQINVDPEALASEDVPEGTYPAIISKCKSDLYGGDRKLLVEYKIEGCDEAKWDGHTVADFLNMEEGKGDFYLRWCQKVQVNPKSWNTDEVLQKAVWIQTVHAKGRDKAGNPKTYVNVKDVSVR